MRCARKFSPEAIYETLLKSDLCCDKIRLLGSGHVTHVPRKTRRTAVQLQRHASKTRKISSNAACGQNECRAESCVNLEDKLLPAALRWRVNSFYVYLWVRCLCETWCDRILRISGLKISNVQYICDELLCNDILKMTLKTNQILFSITWKVLNGILTCH
jgi:hypothetical protein